MKNGERGLTANRILGLGLVAVALATAGLAAIMALSGVIAPALAQGPCLEGECPNPWLALSKSEKGEISAFAEDYKGFMSTARTELTAVTEVVRLAEGAGFVPLVDGAEVVPGGRYYVINRDRAVVLIVGGRQSVAAGVHLVAAHIDSPRLELKGRPLYEREGFVQFQTNFHGGIKPYQWSNIPLALVGRVDRKDGTMVRVSVGLAPGDPVFIIPGLSPHVDKDLRTRTNREVLKLEELDPLAGFLPKSAEDGVKAQVLDYLRKTYGIGEADLVSAELALVPAFPPRDVGFDRGLMAIYGQDDRLSAFSAMRALFEIGAPAVTAIVHLVDNEETGNNNNTGASSSFFVDLVAELIYRQTGDAYREPMLKRALARSKVISVDVNPGINPIWPSAWEAGNAPHLGFGVNLKLYGRGFNANSEFIAWTRNLLEQAGVPWQTSTYKVNGGGGGTVGVEYARHNMAVIDFGVPVLSIHSPYAISAKSDVYWLYKAAGAFFAAGP